MKLIDDSAELHCEVIGNPIPEIQWWFIEGEEPNETVSQLFEGARDSHVHINTTYIHHAVSTLSLFNLTLNDTGIYECRGSNDPDRNDLKTTPKVKWIRSQANVIVFESELRSVEVSSTTPPLDDGEPLRFSVFSPLCPPPSFFPSTTSWSL